MAPFFSRRKPARCPACGSAKVAKILYGLPSSKAAEEAERGRVVLGGCCVATDSPSWQCTECQTTVHPAWQREQL